MQLRVGHLPFQLGVLRLERLNRLEHAALLLSDTNKHSPRAKGVRVAKPPLAAKPHNTRKRGGLRYRQAHLAQRFRIYFFAA
ncbi:hypothetical protein GCM10029976_086840 [Kribbella albertanoniae]